MLQQIAVGFLLMAVTTWLSALLVALGFNHLSSCVRWVERDETAMRIATGLSLLILWFAMVLALVITIWAIAFLALGVFENVEKALYFSMVAFTTLGFGDIVLTEEWRLLSGFIAGQGFILFGFGTALLFDLLQKIDRS